MARVGVDAVLKKQALCLGMIVGAREVERRHLPLSGNVGGSTVLKEKLHKLGVATDRGDVERGADASGVVNVGAEKKKNACSRNISVTSGVVQTLAKQVWNQKTECAGSKNR
ncbi:MAG: hypothetical protein QOE70_2695 [Chthoniobacter sp.]|nr:hypothetical protein [Chthoniobacter sp.]